MIMLSRCIRKGESPPPRPLPDAVEKWSEREWRGRRHSWQPSRECRCAGYRAWFSTDKVEGEGEGSHIPALDRWSTFLLGTTTHFGRQIRINERFLMQSRVWKGILGIRDLTARREAGLTKIWAQDGEFFRMLVGNLGNRHDSNKRYRGQSRWCLLSNQTIECAWLLVI